MKNTNRREFLQSALAVAAASRLSAQTPAANEWGGPVLDIHLHLRQTADGNAIHLDGSGVTKAVLLTNVNAEDRAKAVVVCLSRPVRAIREHRRHPTRCD